MERCKILSTLDEEMYTTESKYDRFYGQCDTVVQRLFAILSYQPGTIKMLERQVMNFHKIMNRSSRSHDYENYSTYVYANVGDFFKVKFALRANSDDEICIIYLDKIEYIKDNTILECVFDSLRMKVKSSPATRNHAFAYTRFSFYENFLKITDSIVINNIDEVKMEIQDFLLDYTNLQELLDNDTE